MTKQEVTAILAILCAYYGTPKADTDDMENAWYLILRDYEYVVTEQACIEYAKNDRREYSQFPTVGVIVESIEEEERCFVRIRNWALDGKTYDELGDRAQKWITEERYNKLKQCGDEYLLTNMDTIRTSLKKSLPKLI